MISRGFSSFQNKRVLLLQGPVGPFFRRLSQDLTRAGAQVFKVNFNGGDVAFYPRNAIAYRDCLGAWPAFLQDLLESLRIDTVMLFGDCRPYHVVARDICRSKGVEVGVFEEGYVRPDYVTLEREGVNGYSPLPENPIYYLNKVSTKNVRADPVGNTLFMAGIWACLYYLSADVLRLFFPCYRHHRPLTVLETSAWLRSAWRKAFYSFKERGLQKSLAGPLSKKFFLVPLQVYNDAQIQVHSAFESVEEFIRRVSTSFAEHADDDVKLVFKHHPMDRGYTDYKNLLLKLSDELKLGSRLLYIHDQHLPTLLRHARGVVVVNSTVGLSALFHKTPLKVCGDSIYDMKGLTFQGSLDDFWRQAPKALLDTNLLERFRSYVIERTQLNGSFYKRLQACGSFTGMRWEERWAPESEDVSIVPHEQIANGRERHEFEIRREKRV